MKVAVILCLLTVARLCSSAQVITGKVIDAQTHMPVPGCTLEWGRGYYTLSNDLGVFRIFAAPQQSFSIRFTSTGYQSLQKIIQPGTDTLLIELTPWALMMQAVEVRALRAGTLAPFAKTNLTAKDIAALNLGQDLPFLLAQTPSVVITSDAGNGIGYTGIRIRGTDATRINMTINGIPYNDAESQGIFFVNLPDLASSLSSLQIQRGVGSSSNGAGAFGASLNLSTNEVHTEPYAELFNSFGSFQTRKHTLKAGSGLLDNHFTVDVRLSAISSDGYIERAFSDLRSYYVSTAYLTPKSSLRLNIFSGKEKTYQAWYGVTEEDLQKNRRVNYAGTERPGSPYDNETDNYQQNHYQLFYTHQFSPALTFQTALYYTTGKGYYEQYKADQLFSRYQLADVVTPVDTIPNTDLIRQLWLDNQLLGQTFSFLYKKKTTLLTIGGGWNTYHGHHFGEVIWAKLGIPDHYRWYDHSAVKNDLNLYTKFQQSLGKGWEAFAELQYRRVDYRIDGFRDNPSLRIDVNYPFLNPKLGFSYTRNQTRWYLSYAVGQKEPNRDDFEANPQQQPLPEFLHDWEAGVEQKSGAFSWSVGGYFMNYRNQLVLTGKINDVGAYTRTNICKSYRLGAEAQGTLTLTRWLKVTGNITVSNNRIIALTEYIDDYDAGGQKDFYYHRSQLAFSPTVTSFLSLAFQPFAKALLTWNSSYTSRQYLDNTAHRNRSLDPYWVQEVQFRYRLPVKFCKEWSVVLQVNNLFDTRYESNGYTYSYWAGGALNTANYYYPMAGRHVLAALNFIW